VACRNQQCTVESRGYRNELLAERAKIRTGGNDYSRYVATLSKFALERNAGTFEPSIERLSTPNFPGQNEDDTADRFRKMWENP
jgi:hypothetical protein